MSENVAAGEKPSLTPKQQKALAALLTGGTIGDAAKLAGISERQLLRWKDEPAFKAALADAVEEKITAAVRALSDAAAQAVDTLRTIMTNKHTRREDSVRVRAAATILSSTLRWKEMTDLEQRLAAVEAALREARHGS